MAGAASSSASSSSENYDVFLSFRGEDTRRNFLSHLYTALLQKQIKTYKDDKTLEKGDEVWPALVRAIKNSYICIVVFSKDYASSTWCLKELTQILDCKQEGEILPVFYEIDPSHVRKQTGSYKEAFEKHEKDSKLDKETVSKWKASLEKAASFSGWHSQSKDFSDDSNFIDEIVKKVLQKLSCKYPPRELTGLIGIEENITNIESLLQKAQTIGIWGMGGIGKTTLARAIFHKLSRQYDGRYFLANVKEESGKHGLDHLRKQLLSKLLDGKDVLEEETSFAMSRLKRKKVFIVLDDVDDSEQLEQLTGDYDCLGSDSRLIVTTRDKQVLSRGEIYKVHTLKFEECIKLFSMHAFCQNHPKMGFEELTITAVHYAGGVPLALKVLGSSLRSKSPKIWESALGKLEKHPNMKIQNVLRLSYDGLDCIEKKIFLDIACFFKGEDKDRVISILDACDFYTADGIDTLINRALITLDCTGEIDMHDLIEEMGKEIVREESYNEPGKYSRLWDPKDIYDVLQHDKESDLIEGIILDMSTSRDLQLNADSFTKMCNLRFLKFYGPFYRSLCTVYIPSHAKLIFDKLSYFQWDAWPLQSSPSTFCSKKLIELHMPNSHVEKLWDGVQDTTNLRIINLEGSQRLIEFPNLSNSSNLESIDLGYCENLRTVDLSNLCLPKLNYLNLYYCVNLESLLSKTRLESLVTLDVEGWSSLKEFSLSSKEIKDLDLSDTVIEILPSSIGICSKLVSLHLPNSLKNLPNELSKLRSLQQLDLGSCRELDIGNLHIIFDGLQSLEKLDLSGCCNLPYFPNSLGSLRILTLDGSSVESLPASIINHLQLSTLSLQNCWRLRHLLELPPSIQRLKAKNCENLCCVDLSISCLPMLVELDLSCCPKLESLLSETPLKSLKNLSVHGCSSLKEFSLSSEEIMVLDLRKTAIEILSSSIGKCSKLESLYLPVSLKNLPNELSNLRSLRNLDLGNCRELDTGNLQTILDGLQSLEELDLRGCQKLESLLSKTPLKSLKNLNVHRCSSLKEFSLCMEEIMVLDLRKTTIKILPSSIGKCSKLESLYLPVSLKNLPNELSNLRSLRNLDLGNCRELDTMNLQIILDGLQSLEELDLRGCRKLKSLLSETALKSLKNLNVHGCSSLKEFSLNSEEIMVLDLRKTAIEILPSSIGKCSKLESLYLPVSLKNLPNELSNLRSLRNLDLGNCRELDTGNLQIVLDGLQSLEELDLRGCLKLESLLSETPLKSLNVHKCSSLKEFSLSSEKIMELDLRMTAIEILPSSIGKCSKLESLYLPVSLKNLPNELSNLRSLRNLDLHDCRELDTGNLHIILDGLQSLEELDLSGCCNLSHFPNSLGALSRLEKLVLGRSSVESLPANITYLSKLRYLFVQKCSRLQHLPELPPSIQGLDAKKCENLCHVNLSISCLPMLLYLDLSCCPKLESLLITTPLRSLTRLDVKGCSSLKEFSLCSKEIIELDLRQTIIEILSSSIGKCSKLKYLYLPNSLKNLPNELSNLRSLLRLVLSNCRELDTGNLHIVLDGLQSLEALDLSGCCNLSHFPHNLGALSRLGILTLDGSDVESLPASITYLSQLRTLSLQYCKKLQHLPELPPSIQLLKANNCISLETVSILMELKVTSCRMDFQNCVKLDQPSLFCVHAYLDFMIKQREASEFRFFVPSCFEACFPGNKIPRFFLCKEIQRWMTIEIPTCFDLKGFAFCIIISPDIMPPDLEGFIISCECHFVNGETVKFQYIHKPDPNEVYFDPGIVGMVSEHVCLWYENYYFMGRLNRIEEKANNQCTNFNQKVFIEFSFYVTNGAKTMKMNQMIKECGVWPILNKKEHSLDLNTGIKTEGCWDIDDQRRKKFKAFKSELELGTKSYSNQNIDEFESSTNEIGVDGTGVDHVCLDELQALAQRKELKEFIFQSLSAECYKQKSREDMVELNLTCLMQNRFSELDETIQEARVCPTNVSEFQDSIDQMDLDLSLALGVK